MIDSTSSFDRASRAQTAANELAARTAGRMSQGRDQVSMSQAAQVSVALANLPEVRAEVVARGKELAADPSYPGTDIISHVAGLIVASPDLSDTED